MTERVHIPSMTDAEILDYCDDMLDRDPLVLLREVIPYLLKDRADANETCMRHQCTSDYDMGQHHGQLAAVQVCRRRNGTCQLDKHFPND